MNQEKPRGTTVRFSEKLRDETADVARELGVPILTEDPEQYRGMGVETVRAEDFERVADAHPDVIGEPAATETASAPETDITAEGAEGADGGDQEQKPFVLDEATVQFYLGFGFHQLSVALNDYRWSLGQREMKAAVPACTPVAQKWLAKLLESSEYKEEIACAIVMGAIVMPRLLMPKLQTKPDGTGTSEASASPESGKASSSSSSSSNANAA